MQIGPNKDNRQEDEARPRALLPVACPTRANSFAPVIGDDIYALNLAARARN